MMSAVKYLWVLCIAASVCAAQTSQATKAVAGPVTRPASGAANEKPTTRPLADEARIEQLIRELSAEAW